MQLKRYVFFPIKLYLFIYLFDRDNANKHSVKTKNVTEVLHIKFIL